ncbi:MAG: hypothetical protein WBQ11_24690, partial [Isosphaeraceae bacterium]
MSFISDDRTFGSVAFGRPEQGLVVCPQDDLGTGIPTCHDRTSPPGIDRFDGAVEFVFEEN